MKYILSLLLGLFLFCCHPSSSTQNTGTEIVKFEKPTVKSLRDFFKSIEVIKLDHQGEIVIGPELKITQQDSSFYIADLMGTQKIYRFNEKGKFQDTIGQRGRGKGEYAYMQDCYICEERNNIYIKSYPDIRLYCYDKKGKYKGMKKMTGQANSFTIIGDRCWIHAGFSNGFHPEQVILADTTLQLLDKYLPLETQNFPASMGPTFFQGKEHTYLIMPFQETVYEVTHDTILPAIRFDFGKLNVPSSFWTSDPATSLDNISNNGFIYLNSIWENENYIIAILISQKGHITHDNYYYCGIKNKKNGHWDWVRQHLDDEGKKYDWFAAKTKGFTKDGRLMIYLPAYQLENVTSADYQLISNPEILENTDTEMDMFLFLCTLK